MFEGLRSPWMTPRACACASAAEHLIDHRPDDVPRQMHRVHPLVDAASGQHVHDEERAAVAELPEVARADDGGVVEERDGARLLVEPPALLGPRLALLWRAQALERDTVARDDVLAQVHDAHTAATQLANDLVAVREDRSDLARRDPGALVLTCGRHGATASLARVPPRRHSSSQRLGG